MRRFIEHGVTKKGFSVKFYKRTVLYSNIYVKIVTWSIESNNSIKGKMSQQTNKKSRTSHRSYTRKLIYKAGEVCNNYDGTKPGEIKLDGLKRDLTDKLTILDKLDNSIIDTVDEEKDIEAEINESSEFRSSIQYRK